MNPSSEFLACLAAGCEMRLKCGTDPDTGAAVVRPETVHPCAVAVIDGRLVVIERVER